MSPEAPGATSVCPRCGFEAPASLGPFADCPSCGVVVAKFLGAQRSEAAATDTANPASEAPPTEPQADGLYAGEVDFVDPWHEEAGSSPEASPPPSPPPPYVPAATVREQPEETGEGGTLFQADAIVQPARRTFSDIRRDHYENSVVEGITREVWIGALVGAVIWILPTSRLFDLFSVLVHETGHTLTFWLFGYPTIPSFDFVYLGGVSVYFFRLQIICWLIIGVLLLWIWQARGYLRLQVLIAALIGLYALFNWTELHQHLGTAMGHGGELVFSTIFFYRALRPAYSDTALERPFYAGSGVYLMLHSLWFAIQLNASSEMQQRYQQGMRGIRHDLVRLADWTGTEFTAVALLLAVASCLPPLLAWLLYRNREAWRLRLVDWLQGH